MEGIDLSGVDPTRWPEIRRRVAILDEYCAIPDRSQRSRHAYAKRLGIGAAHFSALAQIWRERRNPADLPGAQARQSPKPANRLPAASTDIAREVIAELGAMARRRDVLIQVKKRCTDAAILAPSDATITNMLIAARGSDEGVTTFDPEILIDFCAGRLPAAHGGRIVQPRLLVAVQLPERAIVAFDVAIDPDQSPSIERLMAKVRAAADPSGRSLRIRAPHLDERQQAVIGAALRPDFSRGLPTLPQLLAPAIGDVGLVFQLTRAKPVDRLANVRNASALCPTDVEIVLEQAVATHNARRQIATPFALLDQPAS
jgi:hypothetical protein